MHGTRQNILITGATGNVGREVVSSFIQKGHQESIVAGVRSLEKDAERLPIGTACIELDFEDPTRFETAFSHCKRLFLLRPPHISDVTKYFAPLIDLAVEKQVEHIVFLSVQGADENSIIPHHKIEALLRNSGISFTFLRPAYFMQNFSTTLQEDLREKDLIYLPAGKAPFTLVDLEDVGKAAAETLLHPSKHENKAYDLTSSDLLTFSQMAEIIGKETGRDIRFKSPNLLSFFLHKKRESLSTGLILVMMMIHYLPRFSAPPKRTDALENINQEKPRSFKRFVQKNRSHWLKD